jgi:hypothetical protein
MHRVLDYLVSSVDNLKIKTGTTAFNHDTQTPVSAAPARASVAVTSPLPGNVVVAITNPEYIKASNNPLRTPILHQIRYSVNARMSNSTKLPIGTQTHYSLPLSGRYFVGVKSSVDGTTFNQEQVFGVQA